MGWNKPASLGGIFIRGIFMDIQIVPVRDEPVEGDHAWLDLVACEWR